MLLILALLTLVGPVLARCPQGAVQGLSPNDCFKMVSSSSAASWYGAAEGCDEGNLASVSNAFLNGFLQGLYDGWSSSYVWLGGSESNNVWTWMDGTPFQYNNWPRGQPVNGSGLCLATSVETGLWYAQSCYTSNPYICKVPSMPDDGCNCATSAPEQHFTCPDCPSCPAEPTVPLPKSCPFGWSYVSAARSCWQLFWSYRWNPNLCSNYNASWVSIHSAKMNNAVADFLSPQSASGWIPLHKPQHKWQWVDGSPFDYSNIITGASNCTLGDNVDCFFSMNAETPGSSTYGAWTGNFDSTGLQSYVCSVPPTY
jgi:hypothetical protein